MELIALVVLPTTVDGMDLDSPDSVQADACQWGNWLVHELLTLCLDCEGLASVSHRLDALPTIENWPTAVTAHELISELVPPGNERLDAITPSVLDALTNIRVGDVANWRVRSDAADWLTAAGLPRDASLLRSLPPIRTDGAAKLGRQALETTVVSLNELDDNAAGTDELTSLASSIAAIAVSQATREIGFAESVLSGGPGPLRHLVLHAAHTAARAAIDTFGGVDEIYWCPSVALVSRGWSGSFGSFHRAVELLEGLGARLQHVAVMCLVELAPSAGTAETLVNVFAEISTA